MSLPLRWPTLALAALTLHACTSGDDGGPAGSPYATRQLTESCPDCQIELVEVATLGAIDDPASVRDDAALRDCMVARLSDGRFVVSGVVGGGQVLVYSAAGVLEGSFGRRGAGPGEMGADLRILAGAGDTLFVQDDSQARMSVFDGEGRFQRSFPVPSTYRSFATVSSGALIFERDPSNGDDALFRRLDPEGGALGVIPRIDTGQEHDAFDTWVLAGSHSGGIWTASIWTYELWHLSADGAPEEVLTRDAPWFPPGGHYEDGAPVSVRPPPVIRFLQEDERGRLWVYAVVPDAEWQPGLPQDPGFEWGRRAFDTRIEVIDIERGTVLASATFDDWIGGTCGGSLVYAVQEGEDLNTRIQVWKPTLIEDPAG